MVYQGIFDGGGGHGGSHDDFANAPFSILY